MNKSETILIKSQNKSLYNISTVHSVLFVTSLIASLLPWISLGSASLTLGAYDLAEWASLHPLVRTSTPSLLTSLLLRLTVPLSVLVFATAKVFSIKQIWIKIVVIVLTSISLLPPLEFFRNSSGDPNLQQQFGLALATLIIGLISESVQNNRYLTAIGLLSSILAIVCAICGIWQSSQLIRDFQLDGKVGLGIVLFVVVHLISLIRVTYDPN